jgi:DNA-directed RNA polymerase sigma subunit (sigma70/sigma32)
MKHERRRIDLGLAISRALMHPGQTRTLSELAAFCGCTRQNIHFIEQRALRKMRDRLVPWMEQRDNDGLFSTYGTDKI